MRRFAIFLLCVLIINWLGNLFLPGNFLHPLYDRSPIIDASFRRQIEREQPEVVVIGNSLVERGVDFAELTKLSGKGTLRVASGGSASALWYLLLKHQIAAAETPPAQVVIVFKDNVFSVPNLSVNGKYQPIIEQYAGEDEPLLEELAYRNFMPVLEQFFTLHSAWVRYNPAVRETLMEQVRRSWLAPLFSIEPIDVDSAVNRSFRVENFDPQLIGQAERQAELEIQNLSRNYDFYQFVDESFLPAILQVAKEADIQLIFVRYRARHYVEYPRQDSVMDAYFTDMKLYLEAHGAVLVDFSADTRIQMEHFAEGDHYNGDGRIIFTEMLAEMLK